MFSIVFQKTSFLSTLLMCGIMLVSCESSRQALQHGHYKTAIDKAVNKLKRTPDDKESREILAQAYPLYIQKREGDIKNTEASINPFKWDDIVPIYDDMQNVYDNIYGCPAALEVIPKPIDYTKKLTEAKKKSAEAYYQAGITDLSMNTIEKARSAYEQFKKAQEKFPNVKPDILARIEEAKQKATLRVKLRYLPISDNIELQKYSLDDSFTSNEIEDYKKDLDAKEFLDTKFENEANHLVRLTYTQFMVEQPQYTNTLIQRSDSLPIKNNLQTVERYEKIQAELLITESKYRVTSTLEISIKDNKTNQSDNQSISEEYIWTQQWATLQNGDPRALTEDQRKLIQQQARIPKFQELFNELQRKIVDKTKEKISEYYKGY